MANIHNPFEILFIAVLRSAQHATLPDHPSVIAENSAIYCDFSQCRHTLELNGSCSNALTRLCRTYQVPSAKFYRSLLPLVSIIKPRIWQFLLQLSCQIVHSLSLCIYLYVRKLKLNPLSFFNFPAIVKIPLSLILLLPTSYRAY